MNKIEKIRQEVGRLMELNNASMESTKKISRISAAGYYEALVDVENFLDTLTEEPDKSLEEAAKHYSEHARFHWPNQVKPSHDAFIAGAEWQKSQMLKDAVEYKIVNYLAAYPVIYYEVNHLGLKYGDKVKIIIIKEDEK